LKIAVIPPSAGSHDYLLADVRVEGQKINNDGDGYWDWVILRDRLLTVPYTAELRDGALVDITQTDTAENDTASPRFDDNFDAYQWLYTGELSTWQHITVHPLGDDPDLPKMFELRGPDGRVEKAELIPPADLTEDWTLEFETTGASINATYDHTARAEWADMTRSTSSHPDLCTAELAEHQDRGRSLTQRWPRYGRTSSAHRQLGNTTH
jgi:hypothetical protein